MSQAAENPTDALEHAQELMRRVSEHLEAQEHEAAFGVFTGLHPADQAELIAELDQEQRRRLIDSMELEETARVLEHMEPEDAVRVFGQMEATALSDVLDQAAPDVAADFLRQLPEEQSRQALEEMEESEGVAPLLEYSDESAGGIMTTEYLSVRDDITAVNALDGVRILGPEAEDVGSIMIVDEERRPVGSLSLVRLALARPTAPVRDIMDQEVVSVPAGTDQEECARLMEHYDLRYLPVIDEGGRLIGVILVEDLVDVLQEEATEDMYSMTGIVGERLSGPFFGSIRRRLPWLTLNLGTTILAALVISLFESTIEKLVILAVFLPVIAGQGGIGGTQTLTLVIRSIALGDAPRERAFRLLRRELFLGVIHGIFLGVIIGLVAYAWKGNFMLGVVLFVAMIGNMMVAGLAGAATPLALRLLRLDPALGSAVIVTTITDIVGFLLFLGIAAALISKLV